MKDDLIEKLLESEDLSDVLPHSPEPLKTLNLKPSAEALALAEQGRSRNGGIESREFNRADITSKEVSVKFSSATGFARHYVENISLGGMFVRTSDRPGIGTKIPIEFEIPTQNGAQRKFSLMAKVCRETESGLGLQFVDFDDQTRAELEAFVQGALPQGMPIANKIRQSSIERLESSREARQISQTKRKKFLSQMAAVVLLLIVNYLIASDFFSSVPQYVPEAGEAPSITLKGEKVPLRSIRSVKRINNEEVKISTETGHYFVMKAKDLSTMAMPRTLRAAFNSTQVIVPKKIERRTMNSRRRGRP